MKAIILCPGPSLRSSVPGFADLTIAVNRAIGFRSADVWAVSDIPLLAAQRPYVIGRPELFTTTTTAAFIRRHGPAWLGRVTEFESLFEFLSPTNLPWTTFTFTASIVLAAQAGAKVIEVYGCDWVGECDWDNWSQAGNRTDERWKLESQIFRRLTDELAGRGIEVKRIAGPSAS